MERGDFAELVLARRSCRAFLPTAVCRVTVGSILAVAQRTASWCNTQPWQVVVTEGIATERFRDALVAAAAGTPPAFDLDLPSYQGIYLERRRDVAWQLYGAIGIPRGDRVAAQRQGDANFRLFGAPHVAIVTSERALGSYGLLDCGGFIQAFLLAAAAHGVATIAQAAIASQAALVRSHFGLGDSRVVVCGISFGYADAANPANQFQTRRADPDEVVTWKSGDA